MATGAPRGIRKRPPGTCLDRLWSRKRLRGAELAFRATDAVHADIRFRITNTLPRLMMSLPDRQGESNLTLGVKWKTLNKGRGSWLECAESSGCLMTRRTAAWILRGRTCAGAGPTQLMLEMFTAVSAKAVNRWRRH